MSVLGLDTATAATTVAFGGVERRHDPGSGERPGHASRLLGLVVEVLAAAGAGWGDVERLAVGVGPGTFTGLRIGIATAHGLARSRAIDLAGVSTLRSLALAGEREQPVLALIDARRGEAFAAAWEGDRELLAPVALGPGALAEAVAALPAGTLALGDGALRFRDRIEPAGAHVPPDDSPLHRVTALNHCLLANRGAVAPAAVLPHYVRPPDARPLRPEAGA